jgi:YVTN family beta-propeller protein
MVIVTNTVTATVLVGAFPVAVPPDGSLVYIANNGYSAVSAIDAATKAVTDTITGQRDCSNLGE